MVVIEPPSSLYRFATGRVYSLNQGSFWSQTCNKGTRAFANGASSSMSDAFDIRLRNAGFRPKTHATFSGFCIAHAYASPAEAPVPSTTGFFEKPSSGIIL